MIGCGVSTGWGAAINNTTVEPVSTVAVWGLGAVGLAVIQAAKIQGAGKIYAIDINDQKFDIAKKFGADVCYKTTPEKGAKSWLLEQEKWGIGYTYDCTGKVAVMREALEASHRGFGEYCVICGSSRWLNESHLSYTFIFLCIFVFKAMPIKLRQQ